MSLDEMQKKLQWLLFCLNEMPVVVEGMHDKIALKGIGVSEENIFALTKMDDLFSKNPEKVVVLTDRDRRGEELYKKICDELHRNNVSSDEQARKKFFSIFRVLHVEEVVESYKKIEKVIKNGKSLHRYSKIHDSRKAPD